LQVGDIVNWSVRIRTCILFLQIIKRLLELPDTDVETINRSHETALDTAQKMGNAEVARLLSERGVVSARAISPNPAARELKQQVSDIKHEVHSQLEQTRARMQGISKRINKLHEEGLNNTINSTTVVAVLIATLAFAAIFTVPGEYVEDPAGSMAPGRRSARPTSPTRRPSSSSSCSTPCRSSSRWP
jgi:hypothetical protein